MLTNTQLQDFEVDTLTYGIDFDEPVQNVLSDNDVIVPETTIALTNDQLQELEHSINPLSDDGNYGINHYLNTIDILKGFDTNHYE